MVDVVVRDAGLGKGRGPTQLYDRWRDEVSLDEVEKVVIRSRSLVRRKPPLSVSRACRALSPFTSSMIARVIRQRTTAPS